MAEFWDTHSLTDYWEQTKPAALKRALEEASTCKRVHDTQKLSSGQTPINALLEAALISFMAGVMALMNRTSLLNSVILSKRS